MCRRTTCDRCGKPSFKGCGRHIEQVLGDVPVSERCACTQAELAEAEAARPWWKIW